MNPSDHNKALVITYSLIGGIFIVLALALPLIITANVDDAISPRRYERTLLAAALFCIVLFIALLFLSAAYGLYKKKKWARTLALVIAVLTVWYFPLGTALGVYTWWFLHSEGSKRLYSNFIKGNDI